MIERGILQEGAPRFKSAGLVEDASLCPFAPLALAVVCAAPLSKTQADAIRHELNMDTRSCASLGEDRKEPLSCH